MRYFFVIGFFAATLVIAASAQAGTVDFSGHWQLDASKSQHPEEQDMSLDIQQNTSQVTFARISRDASGKEEKSQFSCAIGGNECEFDEGGHKAKVSLWYNGPSLVILKTGGRKEDETVEWHLELASDGKTLKIQREEMSPSSKTEELVYNKAQALAAR